MGQQGEQLIERYLPELKLLKGQAQKACGSRYTSTPTHNASRRYTELLVEYAEQGGSLLKLADALGTSYSSLHRRVKNSVNKPQPRKPATQVSETEHRKKAEHLNVMSVLGTQEEYYREIKRAYDDGYSMNKLAGYMNHSSAFPLYYALNRLDKYSGKIVSRRNRA